MTKRGDVVIVEIPFTDIAGAKKRPCVVVQADVYNQAIRKTVVAIFTGNLRRRGEPPLCGPSNAGRRIVRTLRPVAGCLLQPVHRGAKPN